MSYSSLPSALQLSPSLWDLSCEPFVVFTSHDELKTAHSFSKCFEAINVEFSAKTHRQLIPVCNSSESSYLLAINKLMYAIVVLYKTEPSVLSTDEQS